MPETFYSRTLHAFKENAIAGVVLFAFALVIALSYHQVDVVRSFFTEVESLKRSYGFLFSAIAMSIFAGFLPFLYLLFTKQLGQVSVWQQLFFYLILWGIKGMEIDLLYRTQTLMFGGMQSMSEVALKTAFDQFVYVPFFEIPIVTICYLWKDVGFSFKKLKGELNIRYMKVVLPSVVISTWIIWIPTLTVIYSMPDDLQLPVLNLVLCFFVIIVARLTNVDESRDQTAEEESSS